MDIIIQICWAIRIMSFYVLDRVSCCPSWPLTHYVAKASLELQIILLPFLKSQQFYLNPRTSFNLTHAVKTVNAMDAPNKIDKGHSQLAV